MRSKIVRLFSVTSLMIVALLLASAMAPMAFAAEPQFNDVQPGSEHYNAVRKVFMANIMFGYSQSEFGVSRQLTRGEGATVAARFAGIPESSNKQCFVDSNYVLGGYICAMQANGWANGYDNVHFGPNDPLQLTQLIAFISRSQVGKGNWTVAPANNAIYPNVQGALRQDLLNYVQNVGAVYGSPNTSGNLPGAFDPVLRGMTAEVVAAALP